MVRLFIFKMPADLNNICQIFTGDAASWISALATLVGVAIAGYIGHTASRIAKYQASQSDRKSIEHIHNLYCDAIREFSPSASFNLDVFIVVTSKLHSAIDLARLYGFDDIAEYLDERKKLFSQGAGHYSQCYGNDGNALVATHNSKDLEAFSKIACTLLTDFNSNKHIEIFSKRLKAD